MSSYQKLEEHFKELADLHHLSSILQWDESVMMPAGGGEARASASASLSVLIHQRTTEPQLLDLINRAEAETDLSPWQCANLHEIKRSVTQETCLPESLVKNMSLASARSEQAWRTARVDNDWNTMAPLIEEVVKLTREEANLRAEATGLSAYDAMLDLYEPGISTTELDRYFAPLREFLPGFVDEVVEAQAGQPILDLGSSFSTADQRELGLKMMATLGFDFEHGRLDVSHHPFCGGVPDDVRITTRYREDSFLESLMGVLHETGHALYEQGLPRDWRAQPVGLARGAAVHESQSLLMEMQACRSREFVNYLTPIARETFSRQDDVSGSWDPENLYRHYTRVERGFIRVDADEVTYPLHILLRYEIEKALIEGQIEVADIPSIWDAKAQEYLGLDTAGNYKDGCLQDIHWMMGLIGYFPTYTIGAMTAAQLFSAAKSSRASLMQELAQGDFSHLVAWLRDNVHNKGSLLSAPELLKSATGSELDANYFINHLQQRYGG